jgi:hypothetical protein
MITPDIIRNNSLRLKFILHNAADVIVDNTTVNILVPINFDIKSSIFIYSLKSISFLHLVHVILYS